jgi:hypothetical protein
MQLTPIQRAYLRKSSIDERLSFFMGINKIPKSPTTERILDVVRRFSKVEDSIERLECLKEMGFDERTIDFSINFLKS